MRFRSERGWGLVQIVVVVWVGGGGGGESWVSATETDVASNVSTDGVLMTGGDRDISSENKVQTRFGKVVRQLKSGQGSGQLAENRTKTDRQTDRQQLHLSNSQDLITTLYPLRPPTLSTPHHSRTSPSLRKCENPSTGSHLSSVCPPSCSRCNAAQACVRREVHTTTRAQPSPGIGHKHQGKCPHLQVQRSRDTHDPA